MKPWMLPALAFVLPGGAILWLAIYLRRRWLAKEVQAIDQLIKPLRQVYGKLEPADVETMRATAERRRQAAKHRQSEAARIQTGEPIEKRIHLVPWQERSQR